MVRLTGRPPALHYPIGHNPKAGTMLLDPTTPMFRNSIIGGSLAFNSISAANFKERYHGSYKIFRLFPQAKAIQSGTIFGNSYKW